jgi:hypothetical protein
MHWVGADHNALGGADHNALGGADHRLGVKKNYCMLGSKTQIRS